MKNSFNSIPSALEDFKKGKIIIVTDNENRENEGDFVAAADLINTETINFMAQFGRGLICTAITNDQAKNLNLDLMESDNTSMHSTAFTVSVDAKINATSGISASDRSEAVKILANPEAKASDLLRPGHMFPLIAAEGGLKQREGHTEASIELSRLSGLNPSAVICEILNPDGSMARLPNLIKIAKEHDIKIINIDELKKYLFNKPEFVSIPTTFGTFKMQLYKNYNNIDNPHLMFLSENFNSTEIVNVRIHSECITGDLFSSLKCDCGMQLEKSLEYISQHKGVLIYLRQEGRGIGLQNKIAAYRLQEKGYDTEEANLALGFKSDERNYLQAAKMLQDMGISKINLLTNNPDKIDQIEKNGIKIIKRIQIDTDIHEHNLEYMRTKKEKMNHYINIGV